MVGYNIFDQCLSVRKIRSELIKLRKEEDYKEYIENNIRYFKNKRKRVEYEMSSYIQLYFRNRLGLKRTREDIKFWKKYLLDLIG